MKTNAEPVRTVARAGCEQVLVAIGPRREVLERDYETTREVVSRLHRQPSPVIWRALGG